ncbi:MAG TPA: NYN domain-containing protein [Acidobacteriota bacterium]|nr:NYN domain-containing protein [Acidobacteriota bacterium]
MNNLHSSTKVGIYADAANLYRNGGQKFRYDILREFACRDGAEPARLNVYVAYDAERARIDPAYGEGQNKFYSALRDFGYKVITKEVRWYVDEAGKRYGKANADLDLAVDALLQSERLDRILIASGDGDFVRVVRAMQNKGCRVEVVALDNASSELRREADLFMSGYLVPNLIPQPMENGDHLPEWGEVGSRVRGWCYWHKEDGRFGFMRVLSKIESGLWLTDSRHPESPYETLWFHDSNVHDFDCRRLPSRHFIFDFEIAEAEEHEGKQAIDIHLINHG